MNYDFYTRSNLNNYPYTFYQKPEISKIIEEIKKPEDTKMLGSFVEKAQEVKSDRTANMALDPEVIAKLSKEQIVSLCLLIPTKLSPILMYEALFPIVSDVKDYPKEIQAGILMKMANAAILCEQGTQLLELEIFQRHQKDDPDLFTAPLLYLCAALNKPMLVDYEYSGICRINAETIFYIGLNKLLLKDFEGAERDLIRALVLSKKAKDMKDSIISKMSLASFLNQTPYKVFMKRVSIKRRPKGIAADIWCLDKPLDMKSFTPFFKRFQREVIKEHARRVLFELASSIIEMNMSEVKMLCGTADIDEVFRELAEDGTLTVEINEGIIRFNNPTRSVLIDKELTKVEETLGVLKAK